LVDDLGGELVIEADLGAARRPRRKSVAAREADADVGETLAAAWAGLNRRVTHPPSATCA